MHIIDRKGPENPIADKLSKLENVLDDPLPIDDSFPDEQLAIINASHSTPWYAHYAYYIIAKSIPPSFTYQQKKKFFYDLRHYFWDDPHLYKGVDGFIKRCVAPRRRATSLPCIATPESMSSGNTQHPTKNNRFIETSGIIVQYYIK